MAFVAPYPPYDPTEKSGFSYETVVKRWPIIITGVVDWLHNACHGLSLELQRRDAGNPVSLSGTTMSDDAIRTKLAEGKAIMERVSKLKYEMARDRPLEPIPDDGEFAAALYNEELARLEAGQRNTWFTAPWLYAECYLYRLLRSWFVQSESWKGADPFYEQKMATFKQSSKAICQIASTIHTLGDRRESLVGDPASLKVLFNEMIQMCLWGNATDLSLLTHMSQEDILHLQSVGKEAQTARQEFILKDDEEPVWTHISSLKDGKIDFVLDNSGFELYTDLVFADFLVTYTPYVSKVTFHPKLIPWFVSDVTPPDFKETFSVLLDAAFFGAAAPQGVQAEHLAQMVTRWKRYVDEGVFALSVPLDTPLGGAPDGRSNDAEFWTTSKPYWNMATEAPGTFASLQKSDLVIFKGDLNYRKLTGDVHWPAWTPFEEALGPFAGAFPLLSLRTNKADVVVGVQKDVAERLDQSGEKWRVNGRYALISFVQRK